MSWVVTLGGPLFFLFILVHFVMALLAVPFTELKVRPGDDIRKAFPLNSRQIKAALHTWMMKG